MDIRVQDILVMKKAHPCGDKRWEVLRTGMDFRLRCLGCGHEVMLPRSKAEKNIRQDTVFIPLHPCFFSALDCNMSQPC